MALIKLQDLQHPRHKVTRLTFSHSGDVCRFLLGLPSNRRGHFPDQPASQPRNPRCGKGRQFLMPGVKLARSPAQVSPAPLSVLQVNLVRTFMFTEFLASHHCMRSSSTALSHLRYNINGSTEKITLFDVSLIFLCYIPTDRVEWG